MMSSATCSLLLSLPTSWTAVWGCAWVMKSSKRLSTTWFLRATPSKGFPFSWYTATQGRPLPLASGELELTSSCLFFLLTLGWFLCLIGSLVPRLSPLRRGRAWERGYLNLILRLSHCPVFDHLHSMQKCTGRQEGLEMRLHVRARSNQPPTSAWITLILNTICTGWG